VSFSQAANAVSPPRRPVRCDHVVVRDCDVAQAAELVRALDDQLHKMTTRLAQVKHHCVTCRNGRACETRLEAAALRRDIQEAQSLISRLQRRYLNGDGRRTRDSQLSGNSAGSRHW
jgi:hypothetical protein